MGPPFVHRPPGGFLEQSQLLVAADEWSLDPEWRSHSPAPGANADGLPGSDRQLLSFEQLGSQLLVLDEIAGAGVGGGTDHDRSRLGSSLDSGRSVHDIAGHKEVTLIRRSTQVSEHFPTFDTDAESQLDGVIGGRSTCHRCLHLEGGANGSLGVDLVCRGHAEHCEHRVAGSAAGGSWPSACAAPSTGRPQRLQKRASGSSTAPHAAHCASITMPQPGQKRASSSSARPQFRHSIRGILRDELDSRLSSSRHAVLSIAAPGD